MLFKSKTKSKNQFETTIVSSQTGLNFTAIYITIISIPIHHGNPALHIDLQDHSW